MTNKQDHTGNDTSRMSRRLFLKSTITAAGAVAASGTLIGNAAAAPKRMEPIATLLDLSRCIGCDECVHACRDTNESKFPVPKKPFPEMFPPRVPVEDWSDKTDVTERLTPYNWLFVQKTQVTTNNETIDVNIPRRCMHCDNPPCVKLCPWGAMKQEENGLSRVDTDLCLGGSKCKKVCPWDIPQRQTGVGLYLDLLPAFAGNGVMYKCDRCHDRLQEGEMPACIEACPEDVQTIGPRKEIIKQARALAKEMNGYIYGETENGGTNTIYVSPVPFEKLNRAIESGSGMPHLSTVKNLMASGSALAKAMIIAPFAGLFAAIGKFYLSSEKER